jgi:hypothetical protein
MRYIIIIWAFIIIFAAICLVFYKRKPKIQAYDLKDFNCVRKNIHARKISDKEKIIDYDKLYHKILLKAGHTGNFWDILKRKPHEIWNINKIWALHKIRNKLVHEIDYPKWVSLLKVANDYKKEVSELLNAFKK